MLDLHFGCQPCIKVLFIIFVQIQLITLLHSLYISSHHSHTSHWSKFLSKLIFAFFLSCPINTYGSTNALYYTPFIVSETHSLFPHPYTFCFTLSTVSFIFHFRAFKNHFHGTQKKDEQIYYKIRKRWIIQNPNDWTSNPTIP